VTFVNRMPRYETLSENEMIVLDGGWRRLGSEIGVRLRPPTAFLAGANIVLHAAGWLGSGSVSCYEKYIVDVTRRRRELGD
jgi:trimethylamine:corrinoid methyltransferase-like protein